MSCSRRVLIRLWPVLAGGRVRQAQEVEVRPVVAGIANLAGGQKGLQGDRAAERHHLVGVWRRLEAEVHDFAHEAGNTQQCQRHRAGVFRNRNWSVRRRARPAP